MPDHTSQKDTTRSALTLDDLRRAKLTLAEQPDGPSPERPFVYHLGGLMYRDEGRGAVYVGPVPRLPMMDDDA